MTTKVQSILESLRGDGFPYSVAVYPDRDFDLGPILAADALDVPSGQVLDVSEHLSDLLWPIELLWPIDAEPILLTSAFDQSDSDAKRETLPEGTVWYRPRENRAKQI